MRHDRHPFDLDSQYQVESGVPAVTQASTFAEDGWSAPSGDSAPGGQPRPVAVVLPEPAALPLSGGGYQSGSRARWPVLAAIVAFHAVLIVAAVLVRFEANRHDRTERLTTFTVAEASPPPPAPAEPVPDSPAPVALFAPPQRLALPVPSPVQAVSVPVPPAQPAAAAPAVPAPAPQPAPAAPVTPPDFSAGQLDNPAPAYPYLSRKAREEGVVLLRVLVSSEGRARDLRVERSSGSSRLDEAALRTVRKWRFLPARRAGEPVEAWVIVPVTFSLS